jgi:type IV pilus assembly protein PilC
MVKAGITLTEAFESLADQTKSNEFKNVLNEVFENLKNGQSLAKSLEKHPEVFDQLYINLVKIGEESGTLEESLEFLSKQLAKDYNLQQKIKGALLYPGLIFFATTIMGAFISFFILPQLVDFFTAFNVELPMTTKILLFFANLMKNYGILIFSGIGTIIFIGYLAIKMPKIKYIWQKILLHLPLFGQMISYGLLARFSRNLGIILKSGISITTALDVTANSLDNLVFKEAINIAQDAVTKGKPLAEVISTLSIFPSLVSKMISVGEKTGKLDESLLYLADFYEEEIDNVSKNLTTILEPILLIVIGLVVGFVALAIISPIYELTGSIKK